MSNETLGTQCGVWLHGNCVYSVIHHWNLFFHIASFHEKNLVKQVFYCYFCVASLQNFSGSNRLDLHIRSELRRIVNVISIFELWNTRNPMWAMTARKLCIFSYFIASFHEKNLVKQVLYCYFCVASFHANRLPCFATFKYNMSSSWSIFVLYWLNYLCYCSQLYIELFYLKLFSTFSKWLLWMSLSIFSFYLHEWVLSEGFKLVGNVCRTKDMFRVSNLKVGGNTILLVSIANVCVEALSWSHSPTFWMVYLCGILARYLYLCGI